MFEERVLLATGVLMELKFCGEDSFRLSARKKEKLLVEYKGDGIRRSRLVRGREGAYEFKSVEKLRYDFERDAQDAQPQA